MKLRIVKVNNYNDRLFEESNKGTILVKDIPYNTIWSIRNPSSNIERELNIYQPNWKKYINGNNYYAISWKAVFSDHPQTVTVQIHFRYNREHYHLLVSDNKFYMGSPAGSTEPEESLIEAANREVYEETAIDLSNTQLVEIGYYSVDIFNNLVDYKARAVNTIFAAFLPFEKVKHLFSSRLNDYGVNFINVKNTNLNETELIIAFNNKLLYDVPEHFYEHKRKRLGKQVPLDFTKDFPQRKFLERFMDNKPLVLPKRFPTYQLTKSFKEAVIEWNEINKDYKW
jgi:ADP-ribose pyrophosphatase YjhB (NUDIX family)